MEKDIVIDVKNISKKYTIATDYQPDTLRDKIVELAKYPLRALKGHAHKPKTKEYWALKNISFQVKRGEVLGIIGKNGAGKSTLLKILSRITEPTSGQILMSGRVASLLEVGTGFNPELTGRENIYLNGAIIGMSKKEINTKFNEIVEFSGVGEFLDTPVKRYSSGMYVRLAFAVAAHLESDILIVDEVLAVGDAEFQKKCLGKMSNLAKAGRTVIFVSHNIGTVKNICNKCICLSDGNILDYGKTETVINKYLKVLASNEARSVTPSYLYSSDRQMKIKTPYWVNSESLKVKNFNFGDDMILRFEVEIITPMRKPTFGISLVSQYGEKLFFAHSTDDPTSNLPEEFSGLYTIDLEIKLKCIAPGLYRVPFGIKDHEGNPLIYNDSDIYLEINPATKKIDGIGGLLYYSGKWTCSREVHGEK